ncbi:MAG TPA: class IV adenylate cyclase [Candidatus Nanoarchaeia archaeon]|nr:class IV adenylate cyclase [Candidatus Nanoarchaeia archaeon]
MIEVESKFFASSPGEIRRKAKALGKYTGTEIKIDDYYTTCSLKRYPKESIRIRKVNGFYITNFKKRISYEDGVHAKREIEHKVRDLNGFLSLMRSFGFEKWLRKEKRCEIYQIKNNFHVELNKVKGLGWFVEIEYLVKKESQIKAARKEVVRVMKSLGFREKDAIKLGYTKMLWEKADK